MPYAQYSGTFTYKFWSDHVYEGAADKAKKDAERVFQGRDVEISTVLQLDLHAIKVLIGEITKKQGEYAEAPQDIFTSNGSYTYWERSGKRAKRKGLDVFRYAVRKEDGVYKMHHFDGVGAEEGE